MSLKIKIIRGLLAKSPEKANDFASSISIPKIPFKVLMQPLLLLYSGIVFCGISS
jgi:hypothetical protein